MNKKLIIATLLGITGLVIYKVRLVIARRKFIRERSLQLEAVSPVTPGPYEYTL